MDKEYLYKALTDYFTALKNYGYKNLKATKTLAFILLFQQFLETDFKYYRDSKKDSLWDKFLLCVYGTDCMFPYPTSCK